MERFCPLDIVHMLGVYYVAEADAVDFLTNTPKSDLKILLQEYNKNLQTIQDNVLIAIQTENRPQDVLYERDISVIFGDGTFHEIIAEHIGMPYQRYSLFEKGPQQQQTRQQQTRQQQSRQQQTRQQQTRNNRLANNRLANSKLLTKNCLKSTVPYSIFHKHTQANPHRLQVEHQGIDFQTPLRSPGTYKPQRGSNCG